MLKHAGLLRQIGLLGQTLLKQTVSLQALVVLERDLWERALTQLENLHEVANDNEQEQKEQV